LKKALIGKDRFERK